VLRISNIFFQNLVPKWCVTISCNLSFWKICHYLIGWWHIIWEPLLGIKIWEVEHFPSKIMRPKFKLNQAQLLLTNSNSINNQKGLKSSLKQCAQEINFNYKFFDMVAINKLPGTSQSSQSTTFIPMYNNLSNCSWIGCRLLLLSPQDAKAPTQQHRASAVFLQYDHKRKRQILFFFFFFLNWADNHSN
jgi:hypothetical protein